MSERQPLPWGLRFEILHRDRFTCAFCSGQPGNDRLHIDHIIPCSLGGSDDPLNLVTACERCNRGKQARIYVPDALCDGGTVVVDGETWRIWKRFRSWCLAWDPSWPSMVVQGLVYQYGFELSRVWEQHGSEWDWYSHIARKTWARGNFELLGDLSSILEFGRRVIRPPGEPSR